MKTLATLATIALTAVAHAASPSATQDWVRHYVATNMQSAASEPLVTEVATNGFTTLSISNATDHIIVTGEYPNRLGLLATNVTASAVSLGVTNGMIFAWNGAGSFVNTPASLSVSCVSNECFKFNDVKSAKVDGVDTFTNLFSVSGVKILPSVSASLLPED